MNNPNATEFANAIRSMIAHEDTLVNNRTTWLILIQALLFAAFSSLKCNHEITYVLAVVGIIISISFFISFRMGEKAIGDLLKSWDDYPKLKGQVYPPVMGIDFDRHTCLVKLDKILSPRRILPWVFIIAWIVVCILVAQKNV